MKDKTFTIKASQITSLKEKWATLNSRQMELQWKSIPWKAIEKRVDKLQSRITKATAEGKKGLAKKLQYLLAKSFFAKLPAVRLQCQRKTKKEMELKIAANAHGGRWLMNCLSGVPRKSHAPF